MPIRTSKRNVGKDKKKGNNDTSVVDMNVMEGNNLSSQNTSKDWTCDPSDNSTMKSGRSNSGKSKQLDPDSSSLGGIESAKEAKEKEKHRSWVKTIGIRTLRLRRADKSKQHIPVEEIFASETSGTTVASDSATIATTETSGTGTSSASPTVAGDPVAGEHVKLKKSSRFGAASNGSVLRDKILSSVSTSSSSTVNAGTKTKEATGSDSTTSSDKQDPARFAGDGMSFKAKLIGVLEVSGPRGDRICQEALSETKMAVKAAGEHKQKITVHIALDGLRIRDEKTGDCLYHHQVHKISFIAQDLTDARAFGYIFGSPDMGHRFFGIKTEKSANQVVIAMRDLFQVVFDLKKKEIERAKQQLELQQKFLATRAAETSAPKVDHRSSSIAETYIEGACAALGTPSSPRTASAPEVDLLNLEVELNSLQEGLDNIHNNLAETVPFRGSTASISSDPMNPLSKFSSVHSTNSNQSQGGTTNSNFVTSSGDPFGDSFDPFDSAIGAGSLHKQPQQQQSQHFQYSQNSPVAFANADPFTQVDPFPNPNFSNLENSDSFFNSDPFDTPVGNFSFNFGQSSAGPAQLGDSASGASSGFASSESTVTAASSMNPTNDNHQQNQNSRSSNNSFTGEDVSGSSKHGWQASFDDNFVPDANALSLNGPFMDNKVDIFTELDPLGTGRVRPFVDRKDFFHELKNPPKKVLKDLYYSSTESGSVGGVGGQYPLDDSPAAQPTPGSGSSKVDRTNTNTKNGAIIVDSIPNSFSTNFNPMGFDSKTALHASSNVMGRNVAERNGRDVNRSTASLYRSHHTSARSVSPPSYSPPAPPTKICETSITSTNAYPSSSFSNNEYFTSTASAGALESVSCNTTVPPLFLPPPSSSSASMTGSRISPSFSRNTSGSSSTTKKSPQLLKQMTIASSGITHSSSSPKTLPRSARLGKQFTIDLPSSDEQSPIPNLTPPPGVTRKLISSSEPKGNMGKTMTLSTAVPRARPYSASSDKSMGLRSSASGSTMHSNLGPEPPPRPLQSTMITSSGANISMTTNSSMDSNATTVCPPLPPKKKCQMSTPLSNPVTSISGKHLYTSESKKREMMSGKDVVNANDLPLPLPLRKTQIGIHNGGQMSGNTSFNMTSYTGGRYCIPPPSKPVSSKAPDFVVANIPPRPDQEGDGHRPQQKHSDVQASMTMEQALHQVTSLSLGHLATRLELPVEKLANFTVQQLAEKLTLMELNSESVHSQPHLHSRNTSVGSRGHEHGVNAIHYSGYGGSTRELTKKSTVVSDGTFGFESNFNPEFDDDFSTASAPAGFHNNNKSSNNTSNRNNNSNNNSGGNSYDKYAVFRELTVEDASGFSLVSGKSKEDNSNQESDDDDQSKTLDKSMSRDSSSERTLQVDAAGYPIANTMDDVTDGNLSDNFDDKFSLDEEVYPPLTSNNSGVKCDWATFESNFEDNFAPLSSASGRTPLKLQSVRRKPDSPWDSDDEVDKLTPVDKVGASNYTTNQQEQQQHKGDTSGDLKPIRNFILDDGDKISSDYVLPPDPEEFNFQPFEKPSPIVTVGACANESRDISSLRRSSRDRDRERERDRQVFELEPRSPIIGGLGPSSFTRQSSGSSKHSMGGGKNSDYSDSGRHVAQAGSGRSRTGSRDYEKSDRGERWNADGGRSRDRDRDYCRPDSRNSYTSASKQERKFRDSDDDLRSGGSRSRGRQYRKNAEGREREPPIGSGSKSRGESFDNDEEDDDDDDRSYVSHHSQSSRRHRRYPPSHSRSYGVSSGNPKKRRASGSKDISPERYSNQESDYDDSYDEGNGSSNGMGTGSMRRGDYYSRDHPNYGKPSNHQLKYSSRGRPNSGSGSSRYSNYDRDSPRDYYSRDHHHGKSYSSRASRASPERDRERYSHRRMYYNQHSRSDDELDDENGKIKREYSDDYSCEENQVSRGSRRQKGRRPAGSRIERERERERENRKSGSRGDRDRDIPPGKSHYYTNSPSWDSESQSPDGRDGLSGGDRRKIRWGSNRDRSHHKQSVEHLDKSLSKSPSPLTVSRGGSGRHQDRTSRSSAAKISDFGFEDDFSKVSSTISNAASGDDSIMSVGLTSGKNFDSFQGGDNSIVSLPPQSPFEDNFVVKCQVNSMETQLNSIEFKRGEDDENDNFGDSTNGDVFFPAKFDVDLEVEKECRRFNHNNTITPTIPSSASPSLTPSSTEMTRSSPRLESILNSNNSKRLESIRSEEEERFQSSDDGDLSITVDKLKTTTKVNDNVGDERQKKSVTLEGKDKKNEGGDGNDKLATGMKKSESFNIFEQEKDPFGDDDFFQ